MAALREAGERLRRLYGDEVLEETSVQGLADLSPTEMTVRAVTKVRPGAQTAMQNEYRRLLKQVLDARRQGTGPLDTIPKPDGLAVPVPGPFSNQNRTRRGRCPVLFEPGPAIVSSVSGRVYRSADQRRASC